MWNFFKQRGGVIIFDYFAALQKVPPRAVADKTTETIGLLCVAFMEEGACVQGWIEAALQSVPLNVLTLENKQSMVQTVSDVSKFRLSHLNYELNLLAKRARSSAIRS